jgi:hypothetical protein
LATGNLHLLAISLFFFGYIYEFNLTQEATTLDGEPAITALIENGIMLKEYVKCLIESRYVLKTQLNHLLAVQRFFFWIDYRVKTKQWKDLHKRRNIVQLLKERHEWVAAQIKITKRPAEQQTIARNDRSVLEHMNKWGTMEELLTVCILCTIYFLFLEIAFRN